MKQLQRIVRMTFQNDKIQEFLIIFEQSKQLIANFPGCLKLSLFRDLHQDNVFYTISLWENEQALENYRHSELFHSTWAKTKTLFADKPTAFSLHLYDPVKI